MNNKKRSSLLRLIAFFLVALILVCTFGFTADGWSINNKIVENSTQNNKPSSSPSGDNTPDEETSTIPPQIIIPEYFNLLTGLETTKELSTHRPISFIMSPDSPLYGTSNADILVEIPIEDGRTRLMAVLSDYKNLWKIGSLSPTRAYISNVAKFFGSAIICPGNDDSVSYIGCDMASDTLDLSLNNDYCYSEYSYYLYTNTNLVNAAISSSNISSVLSHKISLPFVHNEYGKEEVKSNIKAESISVIYSSASTTELAFSKESGKYTLCKNGVLYKDLLNNTNHEYKNCFILFSDSVTYEGMDSAQTVINTIGKGCGYYFTNGSAINIEWTSDADGNLSFFTSDGEILTVNRGNSYIAYVKSSRTDSVIFE